MTEEFNQQTLSEIVDVLMEDWTENKMERSAELYGLSATEFKKLGGR